MRFDRKPQGRSGGFDVGDRQQAMAAAFGSARALVSTYLTAGATYERLVAKPIAGCTDTRHNERV